MRLLSKRGQTTAGYNVQIAVDDQHKLLVAVDVTQEGNDTQQWVPMLEKAQEILQSERLKGLGDAGYDNREQLKQAEDLGIAVLVPIPKKNTAASKEGRFTRDPFSYDAEKDCYHCPQGEQIARCGKTDNKNRNLYKSKRSTCKDCPLRTQCLAKNATVKKLERWAHEAVVERHTERMKAAADEMRKRSCLAEHPFGTLKHRAGMHPFLMRGLEKCQGEFSLIALCYNFTRVLNILGQEKLRDFCVQRAGNRQNNYQFA